MTQSRDTGIFGDFLPEEDAFFLDKTPPRKWVNVHCTDPNPAGEELYAEITNIGDGLVVFRDAAGNTCKLVGYDTKQVYVRDDESNLVFCPGGEPTPQAVETTTLYTSASTTTTGLCDGLEVVRRTFVPQREAVELWSVKVKNQSDRSRKVSVFACAMFQLTGTNADGGDVWKDNHSNVHPELGAVLVFNRDRSAAGLGFNGCLISVNPIVGGSGYRDFFTRSDFSLATPKILWGWNCDNRGYRGPDCAGILQVRLEIPAGGTARADFVLARFVASEDVATLRTRWTPEAIDAAAREQCEIYEKRNAAFRVDTGHGPQDALINGFVKKQMVSYLVNKSGFRDNLQNDMALTLCDYKLVRENLCRALASQNCDGSVPHGFRPWNLHHYSDQPAWLLHCVPWVLKESGDMGFLDVKLPYRNGGSEETVWEHMLRALNYLVHDTGANGLCDQHCADWNDGLEPSEKTGARESVMVTQQLCLGLIEVAELARRRGENGVATECEGWHAHFTKLLNDIAWDGDWYVRTLCSDGYTLGSNANPEGKIFVNTQSWAVLSNTAPGSPWNPISNSHAEPFSFTNCYSRTPDWPGMSMYPWRTGTAGWFTMGLVEWILGARRHYDGLLIDPCLPQAIPRANLSRTFRGTKYEIEIVRNGKGGSIAMDGQALKSNILPPPDGLHHRVIANI